MTPTRAALDGFNAQASERRSATLLRQDVEVRTYSAKRKLGVPFNG